MKKLSHSEAARIVERIGDEGFSRLQDIIRYPKAVNSNIEKWNLGEKIEKLRSRVGTRKETTELLNYYGFRRSIQDDSVLLYHRISLMELDKYETRFEKEGWPLTWAILRSVIDCRYSSDCLDLLEKAITERLNGAQIRQYAEFRGLYVRRHETRNTAAMRVMRKEVSRLTEVLHLTNDRLEEIGEDFIPEEKQVRGAVIDEFDAATNMINDARSRLLAFA